MRPAAKTYFWAEICLSMFILTLSLFVRILTMQKQYLFSQLPRADTNGRFTCVQFWHG